MINAEKLNNDRMTGDSLSLSYSLDTGTSYHVTGTGFLTNVHGIMDSPVGLPDGQRVVATMEGRVTLSPTFTLDHVLYVLLIVSSFRFLS